MRQALYFLGLMVLILLQDQVTIMPIGTAMAQGRTRTSCITSGCRWEAKRQKCFCNGSRTKKARIDLRRSRGGPLVSIPAGCFNRGDNSPTAPPNVKPRHTACLTRFSINKYEVTVAQYMRCVKARACTAPLLYDPRNLYTIHCNYRKKGKIRSNHPINCVSWFQARAFCRWAGRRLPSETEWEYAAIGTKKTYFPWGNQQKDICRYAIVRSPVTYIMGCGRKSTWPVGSRPAGASVFGVMDMEGNVSEWTEDCYEHMAYKRCGSRCTNPVTCCAKKNKLRTVRGSALGAPVSFINPRRRRGYYATTQGFSVGFRCAK